MLATLARTDLIDAALGDAHDEAAAERAAHTSELTAVETEIAKTEAAIDRYLTAFENGTMPEATCAPRVESLSRATAELRSRRDEPGLLIDETPATVRPTREHLDVLRDHIRNQAGTAVPDAVQALLQAMTVKIDVASRRSITPRFRIPAISETPAPAAAGTNPKVRTLPGSAPPAGLEPVPPAGFATDGNGRHQRKRCRRCHG
jgi:site-specific DNA recombinase